MAMEDLGLTMAALVTLWVYLPGFLVNTFAMMWGKWFPRTGLGPWPIDGGRMHPDGNRWLGDGKTWNGLIGGSLTSGVLAVLMVTIIPAGRMATPFVDPMSGFDTLIGTLGRGGAQTRNYHIAFKTICIIPPETIFSRSSNAICCIADGSSATLVHLGSCKTKPAINKYKMIRSFFSKISLRQDKIKCK